MLGVLHSDRNYRPIFTKFDMVVGLESEYELIVLEEVHKIFRF